MEAAPSLRLGIQCPPQALFLLSARTPLTLSQSINLLLKVETLIVNWDVLMMGFQATIGSNGRPSNRTVVFR
jgi:hypothetical protein